MRHQHFKKTIFSFVTSTLVAISFVLIFADTIQAASLGLSPAVSKVSVGNIVSVKVIVGTDGKYINNTEGTLQFPVDLLEVMSVTKSSSIFSLWVEEPKFSNYSGEVTFNGGLPNPGYIGQGGDIVTVTFKAKKQGIASLVLSDAAVRQNDGLGTDILTSRQSATVEITATQQSEVPVVNTSSNTLPLKPVVISSTHPDQSAWYSGATASFSWTVPNDVTSIQTLLGKNPTSIPTVTYDGSVSQRTVNNLTDGVLYFHVRYMNNVGWGATTHYKVQIDSTAPEKFNIIVKNQDSKDIVTLNAYDALSGVDTYSLKIDDMPAIRVKKDSLVKNEYLLPTQNQGEHSLSVVAYDKAGNYTESNTLFSSSEIMPPSIVVTPGEIMRGNNVTISGTTDYPDTSVEVSIQIESKDTKKYSTKTLSDGSFSIVSDNITTSGPANIWAQLVFTDNIKSKISEKVRLQVRDTLLVKTSKSVIYTLSFVVPMILLVLILLYVSYLGWHKFFGLRRRINREMQGTVNEIHKAMMLYKDELGNQLEKIEKIKEDRDLNRKEEKIFKELQNNIESIDDFIEKKLKKIR